MGCFQQPSPSDGVLTYIVIDYFHQPVFEAVGAPADFWGSKTNADPNDAPISKTLILFKSIKKSGASKENMNDDSRIIARLDLVPGLPGNSETKTKEKQEKEVKVQLSFVQQESFPLEIRTKALIIFASRNIVSFQYLQTFFGGNI